MRTLLAVCALAFASGCAHLPQGFHSEGMNGNVVNDPSGVVFPPQVGMFKFLDEDRYLAVHKPADYSGAYVEYSDTGSGGFFNPAVFRAQATVNVGPAQEEDTIESFRKDPKVVPGSVTESTESGRKVITFEREQSFSHRTVSGLWVTKDLPAVNLVTRTKAPVEGQDLVIHVYYPKEDEKTFGQTSRAFIDEFLSRQK